MTIPTAHSTFRFNHPTRLSTVREAHEPIWYRAGKARSRIAYVRVPKCSHIETAIGKIA